MQKLQRYSNLYILTIFHMEKAGYKISFCICCMNRLHHLKETLITNVEDNRDYVNLEFVLLDYSSLDGMEEWAKDNLSDLIASGILKYFKINDRSFFNHSHAINIALKLASGDIVCNINADHFIGKGFAAYVNQCFQEDCNIVLTTIPTKKWVFDESHPPGESYGKVCIRKSHFLEVGGLDERMIKWASEDLDFVNRLENHGLKRKVISDPEYWRLISHDNEQRYSSKQVLNDIYFVYVNYISPGKSWLLFLFHDNIYEKLFLIDNHLVGAEGLRRSYISTAYRYKYCVENVNWVRGYWTDRSEAGCIELFDNGLRTSVLEKGAGSDGAIRDLATGQMFYLVTDADLIERLSVLNYTFYNVVLMEENLRKGVTMVNNNSFGHGIVFNNFSTSNPQAI